MDDNAGDSEIVITESYDMDIPEEVPFENNRSRVPIISPGVIYQFHHYVGADTSAIHREDVPRTPAITFNQDVVPAYIPSQEQGLPEPNAELLDQPQLSPASSDTTIILDRTPPPGLRLECTTFPVNESKDHVSDKCECNCHELKNEKKRALSDDDDEDDGKLCPICLDVWTNSGEHRICSVKCGHLFGHSCLERWMTSQKTCPTCKRTIKKTDIRFIYAKKLIALDTSVLNALQLQLDNEQLDKNKLQVELIHSRQREENVKQEVNTLKRQMTLLQNASQMSLSQNARHSTSTITNRDIKYFRENSLEISRDGGCRVMDFYKNSNILVVSAQSPNPLFAGYGIKKVPINDTRNSVFIPLHSNTIRDLSFHPQAELLLSASIDKCARLTETNNNKSVHTVQCSVPIWSCCWDTLNPVYFYVGEQIGEVSKYDMRKTNEKLSVLKVPGDYSPVVSLSTIGWNQDANSPKNCVIVCKLNSCSAFIDTVNTQNEVPGTSSSNHYPLGLSGPFVSMRYCNETQHLLVSSRPNMQSPFAKHSICTLSSMQYGGGVGNLVNCNIVHTFQGAPVQKLLSRSCQMKILGEMYVAAHNESQKGVELFSVGIGVRKTIIPASNPVLDMCHVQTNNSNFLCTLNEKKVDFFRLEFS